MHKEVIGVTDFIFRVADTPELLGEVYRLRFQVYARECKFIREEDHPNGIEKDKFDAHSLNFVGQDYLGVIGTARLILNSSLGFPLEEHCKDSLQIDVNKLPRDNLAEISRLVISKEYRRRRGDGLYYTPEIDDKECVIPNTGHFRRIRPMTFGIYKEIYQESKIRGITHWYAVMENCLWLLLHMHGFTFHPIGNEVDYYGMVKPYLGKLEDIEQEVNRKNPNLFKYFLEGLDSKYKPSFSW